MSELKQFLTIPACSDINLNPPTCCECGGLLEMKWERYRCRKCQTAWQDRLRGSIEDDVKRTNDYIRGKRESLKRCVVCKVAATELKVTQDYPHLRCNGCVLGGLNLAKDSGYYRITFLAFASLIFGYMLLIYWCIR